MSLSKAAEWQEKIQKQQVSGLSVPQWCKENQVSYHSFRSWKYQLKQNKTIQRAIFSELTLNPQAEEQEITLEYCEAKIHLKQNFDSETLLRCMKTLQRLS